MLRRAVLLVSFLLAGCATGHVPEFAAKPYEPFTREDAVAIALREWRLFGSVVDDDQGEAAPTQKPERQPGLWQRVGEYWWIGIDAGSPESPWTGKHDQAGAVFPAEVDGKFAWSAAFISYVMRIAGAGDRFPYAANHATYVNAAAAGKSPVLRARPTESYAPRPGDLLCRGRYAARALRLADLPTSYLWPGHCALVVDARPGTLDVIGGNVYDAVTLSHVPITSAGTLGNPGEPILDQRDPWFVVLEVLYDADAEPAADR